MKTAIISIFLAVAAISAFPEDSASDRENKFQQLNETCSKDTNFKFDTKDFSTKPAKCFVACILEKDGVLNKDGTIEMGTVKSSVSVEKLMGFKASDDFMKVLEECTKSEKPIPDDNCETAFKYGACVLKKMGKDKKN